MQSHSWTSVVGTGSAVVEVDMTDYYSVDTADLTTWWGAWPGTFTPAKIFAEYEKNRKGTLIFRQVLIASLGYYVCHVVSRKMTSWSVWRYPPAAPVMNFYNCSKLIRRTKHKNAFKNPWTFFIVITTNFLLPWVSQSVDVTHYQFSKNEMNIRIQFLFVISGIWLESWRFLWKPLQKRRINWQKHSKYLGNNCCFWNT